MSRKRKNNKNISVASIFILLFAIAIYYKDDIYNYILKINPSFAITSYDIGDIPSYSGDAFVYINNNKPNFDDVDINKIKEESYSKLDYLGRCGTVMAIVSIDTMPTEERESIGMIKPSGWHTVKYDIVDGKYLYNRCHLIGYQLTGENANERNLITCTRSMNTKGMLDFENEIADYVKETNNRVIYRVTPIFEGVNLLASGVQMEAMSIEDNGKGVSFNVYIYNVEDGIIIDYSDGSSRLDK